jgi:hypothetical protein
MNLERYEYEINREFREYEFYSEGPKGKLKKVVRFILEIANGIPYYNICFGDWNDEALAIDDNAVSNNGDRDKLLATIAVIILDFSRLFPDSFLYAQGRTPSRTRLYRMGINKLWNEIVSDFDLYGVREDNTMEPYRKNINYKGFLLRHK